MVRTKAAAERFLANRRIAVTGVSRNPQGHGSNIVYQRLLDRGYDVFAVNPNADTVEGDPCFPDLRSIPGGVGAVVIGTRPDHAEPTMREAVRLGSPRSGCTAPSGRAASPTLRRYTGASTVSR